MNDDDFALVPKVGEALWERSLGLETSFPPWQCAVAMSSHPVITRNRIMALALILSLLRIASSWAESEPQWKYDIDLTTYLMSPNSSPVSASRVEIRITTDAEAVYGFYQLADERKRPISYASDKPDEIKAVIAALQQREEWDSATSEAIHKAHRATMIHILLFDRAEAKYAGGMYNVAYVNGVPKGFIQSDSQAFVGLNQAFCEWLKQHKLLPPPDEK